jgi:nitrite reductase/ring-hydroxylating ferredoxin subunit
MTMASHRVGHVDEIPLGEGRAFSVGSDQVAVFRLRDGELRAVSAICPHSGGPLADGQIDGVVVVCPLHQHAFELASGSSVSGQPPLQVYPVEVDAEGAITVAVPCVNPCESHVA